MRRICWRLTTAVGAALALAGCNKSSTVTNDASADQNTALPALPEAVPMQTGPAAPPAMAPAANALPMSSRVSLASVPQPSDAYAFADRASGFNDAIGDAPPDYAFDYNGVSPWAWQTSDGDTEFAEPVAGGYRTYYYQPGADSPYLVRDPSYSYAYDGPRLVAVYGAGGALLAAAAYREHVDAASRYRERAADLYRASREREHRGVVASNWAARRSEISAEQASWAADRARQADWQAYHQSHEAAERDHWDAERQRRSSEAQRFTAWQQEDFRGAQPGSKPITDGTRHDDYRATGEGQAARPEARRQLQPERQAARPEAPRQLQPERQAARPEARPQLQPERQAAHPEVRSQIQPERQAGPSGNPRIDARPQREREGVALDARQDQRGKVDDHQPKRNAQPDFPKATHVALPPAHGSASRVEPRPLGRADQEHPRGEGHSDRPSNQQAKERAVPHPSLPARVPAPAPERHAADHQRPPAGAPPRDNGRRNDRG